MGWVLPLRRGGGKRRREGGKGEEMGVVERRERGEIDGERDRREARGGLRRSEGWFEVYSNRCNVSAVNIVSPRLLFFALCGRVYGWGISTAQSKGVPFSCSLSGRMEGRN